MKQNSPNSLTVVVSYSGEGRGRHPLLVLFFSAGYTIQSSSWFSMIVTMRQVQKYKYVIVMLTNNTFLVWTQHDCRLQIEKKVLERLQLSDTDNLDWWLIILEIWKHKICCLVQTMMRTEMIWVAKDYKTNIVFALHVGDLSESNYSVRSAAPCVRAF